MIVGLISLLVLGSLTRIAPAQGAVRVRTSSTPRFSSPCPAVPRSWFRVLGSVPDSSLLVLVSSSPNPEPGILNRTLNLERGTWNLCYRELNSAVGNQLRGPGGQVEA